MEKIEGEGESEGERQKDTEAVAAVVDEVHSNEELPTTIKSLSEVPPSESRSAADALINSGASNKPVDLQSQIAVVEAAVAKRIGAGGAGAMQDVPLSSDSRSSTGPSSINGFSIADESAEDSNDIVSRSNYPGRELHYHPGRFGDILNPAYIRYVNVNLGGLRFLGELA